MNVSFHIHFNGQCREAFEYYANVLDGKIGTMLPFSQSPEAGNVPEAWKSKIVHGNIEIGDINIAGDDLQPEHYKQPNGFYILLGIEDETKTRAVFESLSKNGKVVFPLQKTFWSPCYGIVIDQFGVPWKVNCAA